MKKIIFIPDFAIEILSGLPRRTQLNPFGFNWSALRANFSNAKFGFILVWVVIFIPRIYAQRAPEIRGIEPFTKDDSILIIAPHPDDEAIGCAGIIQQAQKAGADVHILYLTNGDYNQLSFIVYEKRLAVRKSEFIHLGEVRRKEATKAMELLGISEDKLIFLGYPDFGTFNIFRNFWDADKPYKSILTRVSSVPYKEDMSFGDPYTGQSILENFKIVLRKYQPNKIFVTASLDTNPDHKAANLFLEVALADLRGSFPDPQVYNYLVHWKAWPLPRHYHPGLPLSPPSEFKDSGIKWFVHELTAEEIENKRNAVFCYKSQTESSAFYLLAFCRKNELFAKYPEINTRSKDPQPVAKKELSWNEKILALIQKYYYKEEEHPIEKQPEDATPVSYEINGKTFIMKINKPRDIKYQFGTLIYLFGYSHKTPFEKMPKIRMVTKHNRFQVFNGRKEIHSKDVSLKLEPEKMTLEIPLLVLGEPDFIFTSVKEYPKNLYIDYLVFRKVNLPRPCAQERGLLIKEQENAGHKNN